MEKLESIWQIDERILPEIASRKYKDYTQELWRLFQAFRGYLRDYYVNEGSSLYDDQYIKSNVYKRTLEIKKLMTCYQTGDLMGVDKYINRFFKVTGNKSTVISSFPTTEIIKNSLFYRCRTKETNNRKDMFHPPFTSRGCIGTNRFSFPGYPCLYLSTSLESSLKETIKDESVASVSAFRNLENIEVFDFRFYPECDCRSNNLEKQLMAYPFKIAASIPIVEDIDMNKEIVYKEEYIIPQIMLHAIIRQRIGKRPIGIFYSSTKAIREKISRDLFGSHQAIAIPAMSFAKQDYCFQLCNKFSLTKPISFKDVRNIDFLVYENDLLKKDFQQIVPTDKNE